MYWEPVQTLFHASHCSLTICECMFKTVAGQPAGSNASEMYLHRLSVVSVIRTRSERVVWSVSHPVNQLERLLMVHASMPRVNC